MTITIEYTFRACSVCVKDRIQEIMEELKTVEGVDFLIRPTSLEYKDSGQREHTVTCPTLRTVEWKLNDIGPRLRVTEEQRNSRKKTLERLAYKEMQSDNPNLELLEWFKHSRRSVRSKVAIEIEVKYFGEEPKEVVEETPKDPDLKPGTTPFG